MKKITTAKSLNNRMLNKLRIEFVIIAMISLVIMQSIIIYISGSYIYNKMLKKSDILINEIYVFLCDVYATMFGYCTICIKISSKILGQWFINFLKCFQRFIEYLLLT